MKAYEVSVSMIFDDEDEPITGPLDAALRMAEWLAGNAHVAGYVVECPDGSRVLVDAETGTTYERSK